MNKPGINNSTFKVKINKNDFIENDIGKKELKQAVHDIMYAKHEKRNVVLYTGFGGYMTFNYSLLFTIYGKTPFPRKKKKCIWKSKKERKKYCPEYYTSPRIKKIKEQKIINILKIRK